MQIRTTRSLAPSPKLLYTFSDGTLLQFQLCYDLLLSVAVEGLRNNDDVTPVGIGNGGAPATSDGD